jgi:hypothetical protein
MKVIINTKSNYRNLNGKKFEVKETFENGGISIDVYDVSVGRKVGCDFGKAEFKVVK